MTSIGRFCMAAALTLAIPSFAAPAALAEVRLPAIISDNMVLQQKASVPIWGWAADGERVTVRFQGQERSAVAKNGRWSVTLENLKAGGPFVLQIEGRNKIEFKNVLVGEVWLCSGQSNMRWPLEGVVNAKDEVAQSANPNVRLFHFPQKVSQQTLDDIPGFQWQECRPETAKDFSAVGYYFARALSKARNIPVGVINASYGGSAAVAWVRHSALEADPGLHFWLEDFDKAVQAFERNREAAQRESQKAPASTSAAGQARPGRGKTAAPAPPQDPRETCGAPSGLWNGMIAPIQPFAVKGFLWYQGESDTHHSEQYAALIRTLIRDWRQDWGQGDLPFVFVQLAGFGGMKGNMAPEFFTARWPWMRETQLDMLKIKNTAMAVAIDVGDPKDIHPRNKLPVGERLALAARAVAYGERFVYSGPAYKSMKIQGGKIALSFDHVGGGLVGKDGELAGFEICGADRKFVPAKAEISGEKVIVSSPEVRDAVAVRYAWAGSPVCNLYNKEGLPASPFRTDRVEGPGTAVQQEAE